MPTTRTSRRDNNYFSIHEGITNCEGSVGVEVPHPPVFAPMEPEKYDAILKLSATTGDDLAVAGIELSNVWVLQGGEAALDINGCGQGSKNLVVDGVFGHVVRGVPQGRTVIVIKGGSAVEVRGVVRSRGRLADIIVGDWSDESYSKSRARLELIHEDGDPVRVAYGRSDKPEMSPNCKVLFWLSLGLKLYWWAKYALVKVCPRVFERFK
jgi:hypothetical protein